MEEDDAIYAIAVTDIPQYYNQCKQIKRWLLQNLNIYFIFVSIDKDVKILIPK
ncbi:MAG: hypothetical protein N4A57_17390 [Anaeromicrobium sp.]|jgi:hypothetical protein|uniref:hypothetical protein n=1 Tax=Anaeromicrobium sp. TaxID=1929132 RepID=UPI0025D1A4C1|nr:hypothetical protein [Anaeromicrobium sp.]MCT4596024.1 hypothetical protein [Anaeromicrobium sp.]